MSPLQEVRVEVSCSITGMGDALAVVGQGAGLGNWDPQAAMKLDGSGFPLWRGALRLPAGSRAEYKYVVLKAGGGAEWEAFDGNRVRQVEPGCSWQDGTFGTNSKATPLPGAGSGGYAKAEPAAAPAAAPVAPRASGAAKLRVKCSDTKPGDAVAVAGSWDWGGKPHPLDGSEFPIWRGTVPSNSAVEYKYVLVNKQGDVQWEPREGNRTAGPGDERDDGELRFSKPKEPAKDKDSGRKGGSGAVVGLGSGIITGDKSTIYGKVSLDYGTLQQRMEKRMNQPEALHGDHDQGLHDHTRHGHRAHLEEDLGALEGALTGRAEALHDREAPPDPPSTSLDQDSAAQLKQIVEFEGRGAVTLMDRFKAARDMLEGCQDGSPLLWTVWVWLRFSQSRQLTWQRRSNTRPMFLATATQELSELISRRWVERPKDRLVWRLLLSTVPRGSSGDDGQAIRDEILVIMQKHQLKKRKGDFMEQWHQKLHNNTTPDDIYICEAYLNFLRSNGDLQAFYGHLEYHNINRERLQTFERPILQEPIFFPTIKNALINDFEHYLQTLKKVHAGADLEKCIDAAGHHLDGGVKALLETIFAERFVGGDRVVAVLGMLGTARASLPEPNGGNARDLLYLDLALEAHQRLLVERLGGTTDMRRAALAAGLLLEALHRSRPAPEARASLRDFVACLGRDSIGGYDALRASALAERARCSVAADSDFYNALQSRAERMGAALRAVTPEAIPEAWATELFAEEAARGGPGFAVSLMLSAYEKRLRQASGGSAWQLVSRTAACAGTVHVMASLTAGVQLPAPSIVLTDALGGEEDPPEGTVAVLTCSAVDVLSHVAVRARTMGVFLATCFERDTFEALKELKGKVARVSAKADAVVVEESALTGGPGEGAKAGGVQSKKVSVSRPPPSSELWVDEQGILAGRATGAKSRNLAALRAHLPEWVKLPSSAVVPHGVLARVMAAPENARAAKEYQELSAQLAPKAGGQPEVLLPRIREAIKGLQQPASIGPDLQKAVEAHGARPGDGAWWRALTAVWASSWSDRAFYACSRAGIQAEDVAMAVLVQKLVAAEYSFVLHTVHPTGDPSELYGEVVVGLGEVLVGNYPGRALSFAAPRDGSKAPRVTALPSKAAALSGTGLIFRSDSNAEDLEDFAGAGLFDSVPVTTCAERIVEYRQEKLVHDLELQTKLLAGLAKLAMVVEAAAGGSPQDIEGCYAGGQFYVVQTRPQA